MSDAQSEAIASLLNVVEELCQGLAAGQQPEPDWAAMVSDMFSAHRIELGVR